MLVSIANNSILPVRKLRLRQAQGHTQMCVESRKSDYRAINCRAVRRSGGTSGQEPTC